MDEIAGKGLSISGLGYYPNPLHPDPAHRETVIGHLRHVITAAEKMDVPYVNTFMGADSAKTQDQNWDEALRVWPDIVAFAGDHGRKITIENCPMLFSDDEWPGGNNLATTPRMWRRILEQWGGTIGLNFDPSPPDPPDDRHSALHPASSGRTSSTSRRRTCTIDREGLYERGVFAMGIGWQIPRLPGLGDVEWDALFGALWRTGFDGDVIIEHEDRDFEKTDELIKRGFLLARDVLRPYIK